MPNLPGFGNTIGLDLDLVIPNPGLSLKEGAIEPWTKPQHEWAFDELKQFCKSEKISLTVPFAQLSRAEQRAIVEGKKDWQGARLLRLAGTKSTSSTCASFFQSIAATLCVQIAAAAASGRARDVKVGGQTLPAVCALSMKDAAVFFDTLKLSTEQGAIAERILFEIRRRLRFLVEWV